MPKLTLFLDFSPNAVTNFYAVNALPSFPSYDCALCAQAYHFHAVSPTHIHFLLYTAHQEMQKYEYSKQIDNYIESNFKHLLENQSDIILTHFLPDVDLNIASIQYLKKRKEFSDYTIEILINIGRANLVCEQNSRKTTYWITGTSTHEYSKKYYEIPKLISSLHAELGEKNVSIVFDDYNKAYKSNYTTTALQKILRLEKEVKMPLCLLDIKSKQGRDFAELIFIEKMRSNLELDFYQEILQDIVLLENNPVFSSRFDFSNNTEATRLEEVINHSRKLGIYPFSTAIEEEYISSNYKGLQSSDIQFIAKNLSKNVLEKITLLFQDYVPLLNPLQKQLLEIAHASCSDMLSRVKQAKLCVLTLCYNHEKFIAKCIESVQAQITNFPIVHIILDHASTDKSQEIIAEYTKKYDNIVPFFCTKRFGEGFNVRTLFSLATSPFVAICDGDDYFIDTLKLQKQVDFLEQNPNTTLCFHPVQVVYEDKAKEDAIYPNPSMLPRGIRQFYYLSDLIKKNFIQTNSVVYRWRFQQGLPEWFRPDLIPGDWYWHLLHAENGKIGYIDELMSAYFRHKTSLYQESEFENVVKHRLVHGLSELEALNVINSHFNNAHFEQISRISKGVFANYTEYYKQSGDDSYINDAVKLYPNFAQDFFLSLKDIHSKQT